jgi:release factor glutamine methyltransferase
VDALDILKSGKEILKNAGIKDYNIEAEIILSNILGVKRYKLWTEKIIIPREKENQYFFLIQKRIEFIPTAYLIKQVYFWKYKFSIEPGVFIPRPETELIIETAKQIFQRNDKIKILDVCTGSGIIAVCLSKEFKKSDIIATDISGKAIKTALINAKHLKSADRIKFFKCNLFPPKKILYNLIVSNPPYISSSGMVELQKEVQKEPKRALFGGKDGLIYHKKIIKYAKSFLKKNGYLIMEISPEQKDFFLTTNFYPLKIVDIKKDYALLDRVVIFKMW